MKSKKVLFVIRPIDYNFPIGLRYINYIKFLENRYDLTIINLAEEISLFKQKNKLYRYANFIRKKYPKLILTIYKYKIRKMLRKYTFDTVIITVLPFIFLELPGFIKGLDSKIRVIVDMSDPVTGNISFKNVNSKRRKYLENLERKAIPFIDTLVVLNDEIKSYYTQKYSNQTIVIEQGISSDVKTLMPKNKMSENISLTYAGHLYKDGREPFELYKAVQNIKQNIELSIYGKFNRIFIPPQNEKFFYGGKVTRQKLYEIYDETDIIVFIDNKDTIQVPGKTFEVLALNKPILFIYYNDDSPTLKFTNQFDGIYYTRNDSKGIIKAIKNIINSNNNYYDRDLTPFYWKNLVNKISNFI